MTDVLKQMEERMPRFSKGQRQIARYMLEHYEKAAYQTASRLGAIVGVSESTVVRFAIELGYAGYPELQKALQELVRTKLTTVQRIEVTNDRIGDARILEKVLASDLEKLRHTLEHADYDGFDRAIDAILSAKMIYIIGVRSSAALASFLYFYFNLIFENVRLIQATSGSEIFEQIFRLEREDAVIGISFPRYSKQLTNAMEFAKNRGARTVALTDSPMAPIAALADHLLLAKSDMVSFVDSLVAPLSIINAIIVAIAKKKQTELSEIFGQLESVWDANDVYEKFHES